MKKFFNSVRLSGYLYDHKLSKKVTGPNSKNPGTEFISGTISLATDDELTNIVDVHYTYITATNKNGEANRNFVELSKIIDGEYKTVMSEGADLATMLAISNSAIDLNDFYVDENGEDRLVSAKRNEGGWISRVKTLSTKPDDRNVFDIDMMITGVRHVEENELTKMPMKTVIKGYIFNYKNILPVEFSVTNLRAMDYFESLEASGKNPYCTHLKGREISETIVRTITTPGAWEDDVREVTSSHKDFVVHWCASESYMYGDESFITEEEVKEAVEARNVRLAQIKNRYLDYKNNKGTVVPASAPKKGAMSDFDLDF